MNFSLLVRLASGSALSCTTVASLAWLGLDQPKARVCILILIQIRTTVVILILRIIRRNEQQMEPHKQPVLLLCSYSNIKNHKNNAPFALVKKQGIRR
jgi:hypothetical protein